MSKGKLFWEDAFIQLYELPLSAFMDSLDNVAAFIDLMQSDSVAVEKENGMICSPNCDGIIFDSYEVTGQSPRSYYGTKARTEESKIMTLLDTNLLVDSMSHLELSFWVYIDPAFSGMPAYEYFSGTDPDLLVSQGKIETRDGPEVDLGWVRVQVELKAAKYHRLLLYGKNTTVDNLLIKDFRQSVFITNGEQRLFNNYLMQ